MALDYGFLQDASDKTVSYMFLASRLYPYLLDESVKTDEMGIVESSDTNILIALDVTTSMKTSWNGDVSKYAVSSGSEISDHLSIRNNTYSLTGVITDSPMQAHNNELLGSLGTGIYRMTHAVEALKALFVAKRTMTFFTEHEKIENVVITKVDFETTSEEALVFNIEFEEVRFAYAKTVTLNVKKSAKKSVASNKNGGGASKVQAQSQADYEKKLSDAKTVNELKN